ncbi:MAG: hypothetical protein RL692_1357 [Planctomycetota bacterium]
MNDTLLIWIPHLLGLGFIFAFGACVGSFINVVSLRIPEGMSVISPPSRCSICGRRLTWYENLPVIGWLIALGRCWSCKAHISFRYPAVEIITGGLFAAYYAAVFVADPYGWLGRFGGSWFQSQGFIATIPAFAAIVALLAALFAATLTDLRTFSIPLSITLTPTIIGLVAWTAQGMITSPTRQQPWPIPLAESWPICAAVIGGGCGTAISLLLLAKGIFLRSFSDYHEYVKEGEVLADYPHARREMRRELVFLLPIVALALTGFFVGRGMEGFPPKVLQSLAGAGLGYFAGAGIMWFVRILASLIKGVEAMGMGDVHLMGAAGATLGWIDPVIAFFLAPFSGLAWVAISGVWGSVRKGSSRREIPYGPHLALAIVAVVLLRPVIIDAGRLLFPGLISANTSLHERPNRFK